MRSETHTDTKTILIAVLLWFLAWTFSQGIFMSEVLTRIPVDINLSHIFATIWVLLLTLIALWAFPRYRCQSLPNSKLLWLYVIPAILFILLPLHYAPSLNVWVYIPMIAVTVFWQNYLTFGLLQTRLAKSTTPNKAAMITALVFLIGHLIFFLNDIANPQFILIASAGVIFAFLRRYAGNIYIGHIIHTVFYLI